MNNFIKNNGVIYTPKWIVETILNLCNYNDFIYDKKIIDPACGDGAFLKEVVRRIIKDAISHKQTNKQIQKLLGNNIYGFDIDKLAISSCKKSLTAICAEYGIEMREWSRIQVINAFSPLNKGMYGIFDFVVGNPPYVRIQNLNIKNRELLQNNISLCSSGSTDLYIAFFELGYKLLNANGKLGFITPNSFTTSAAGEKLRVFLLQNHIETIVDFEEHQVFNDATTYTAISIINKECTNPFIYLYKGTTSNINFISKLNKELLTNDHWILFNEDTCKKLHSLSSRGVKLGDLCTINTGIATLADNIFIIKNPQIINGFCQFISSNKEIKIEAELLKKTIKASTWKGNDDNQNIYTIFPYKKIDGKFQIIKEDELKKKYPLTFNYFLLVKKQLDKRDAGKPNPVAWYAFGRSQGLNTAFGKKILTSPINKIPRFFISDDENSLYYSGYSIKYDGDLDKLLNQLNSEDMKYYIDRTSKNYRGGYKSYAKSFIKNFGIDINKL